MQRCVATLCNVKIIQRRALFYTISCMLHRCKQFTQGKINTPVITNNVPASLYTQRRTQLSTATI